jgi:hypothetical protein
VVISIISISEPLRSRQLTPRPIVQLPDCLFQLDDFADLRELFACCGEFISLFGRTGNS